MVSLISNSNAVDLAGTVGPFKYTGNVLIRNFHRCISAKRKAGIINLSDILKSEQRNNSDTVSITYSLAERRNLLTALNGIPIS